MAADAIAPKVARASAGMVLYVQDRQHCELTSSAEQNPRYDTKCEYIFNDL